MDSKKKNFVIAAIVAAGLSLAAGTVAAQDYFVPLFGAYVDHVVPPESPCGYSPIRQIAPSTYENTVMLWYLCEDNRVIARRFFRPGTNVQVPQPVYLVNAPDGSTASAPPAALPSTSSSSCAMGLVPSADGQCVSPTFARTPTLGR
jgi:hypothetical protein